MTTRRLRRTRRLWASDALAALVFAGCLIVWPALMFLLRG